MVMAIGLVVDFSAHIVHTYYAIPDDDHFNTDVGAIADAVREADEKSSGKRPKMAFAHPASTQRMINTMIDMGPNVLAGGFSTFLGTCWLAFS